MKGTLAAARLGFGAVALLLCARAAGATAVDDLLKQYAALGAADFSASAGESFWEQPFIDAKSGQPRKCSLCHTNDLKRTGKHATTGKVIEPLAPSVNPKRLTDAREIEKWLGRNCKWTLGRECTPQEKGNVLMMIRGR